VKIMLLCSAFNGLTQRVWTELRGAGHPIRVQLAGEAEAMCAAVTAYQPDLIICPFLRERVPARIWRAHRTIIIHPGPPGDRGPSSLDWAISDGEREWGVTALQAVEEMDAGPIWGSRIFPIDPSQPPRKSSLYSGPVTDAAIELVHEILAKAGDPTFVPTPLDYRRPEVRGRLRPAMPRSDRNCAGPTPRRRSCGGSGPPTAHRACVPRWPGRRCRCSTPTPVPGSPAGRATSCAAATGRCSSAPGMRASGSAMSGRRARER
jgi:putative two-component system hydrogenase maturation factor HypX/HoxX